MRILSAGVLAATLAATAHAQFGNGPGSPTSPAGERPAKAAPKDNSLVDAAFVRADTNKDGALTPQEASRMPAISAKFATLDTNSDGVLDKAEFTAGYSAAP